MQSEELYLIWLKMLKFSRVQSLDGRTLVLTETYAVRQVMREAVIAYGMDVFGLLASSPVVAIMSNPMKA